ncbi:hypothetical protein ACFQ60_43295 [Streptomyces zhihengii]
MRNGPERTRQLHRRSSSSTDSTRKAAEIPSRETTVPRSPGTIRSPSVRTAPM